MRSTTRRARSALARTPAAAAWSRVRAALTAGIAFAVARSLGLLPARVQGRIKQSLRPTAVLDYPRSTILIAVDSEIERTTRAISCRKEPETVAWIEEFVEHGDVVYDVGANVGAYSLVVDAWTSGEARVFAFEPVFSNFTQLNRNIFLNGAQGRVVPVPVALADRTGMVQLGYSSLDPGTALHGITGNAAIGADGGELVQPVIAARIDDLQQLFEIPAPNHIKLDVDGAEFAILRGAVEALADPRLRSIIIETELGRVGSDQLQGWLSERGFELRSVHPHGDDPRAPANAVFVRTAPTSG